MGVSRRILSILRILRRLSDFVVSVTAYARQSKAGTHVLGVFICHQELAGGVNISLRCLRFQSSPASLAARRASTTTSELTLNGSL